MKAQHIIWFLIGMGLLASVASCKRAVIKSVNSDSLKVVAFIRLADSADIKAVNTCYAEKQQRYYEWESVRYLDSAAKYTKLSTAD